MNSETITSPAPPTDSESAATDKQEAPIVGFVRGLKERDDKGSLAVLRGALSNSQDRQMRAYRLLAPFGGIPSQGQDQHHAEVVRIVAGLMTLPKLGIRAMGKDLGYSCRKLLAAEERKSLTKAAPPGPVARRMQHLLAASRDEVCDRVCALVRRIANEDGNIDFTCLYRDLCRWNPRTKANWAGSFWGAAEEDEDDNKGGDEA